MKSKKKTAAPAKKSIPNERNKTFPLNNKTVDLLTSDEETPKELTPIPESLGPNTKKSAKAKSPKSPKVAKLKAGTPVLSHEDAKKPTQTIAIRKKVFLNALTKNLGIVAKAVRESGIPMRTHYQWLEDDPLYRDQVTQVKEVVLDFYEDALQDLVKQRQPAAVIFALKTQGKKRGYIETIHNIGQNMDDNNVTFYLPDNSRLNTDIQDAKVVNE